MLAEVAGRHTIHPALDRDTSSEVFQFIQPLLVRVTARCGEIVADLYSSYIRLKANTVQA